MGRPFVVVGLEADIAKQTGQQGNLLNWATMRRIDVAKRLLNGGKASPRSPNPGFTVELWGEVPNNGAACDDDRIIGTFNNAVAFPESHLPAPYTNIIYPFLGNYTYTLTHDGLTVNPPTFTNPIAYPNTDKGIPASWTITGAGSAWSAVDDPIGAEDGNATTISTTTVNQPAMVDYNYTGTTAGTIQSISIVVQAKKSLSNQQMLMEGVLNILDTNTYVSPFITFSNNTNYQQWDACLGCCAQAPVVEVDGRIYGKMTRKKLQKVLANYESI